MRCCLALALLLAGALLLASITPAVCRPFSDALGSSDGARRELPGSVVLSSPATTTTDMPGERHGQAKRNAAKGRCFELRASATAAAACT
jgi:hypothetical protein